MTEINELAARIRTEANVLKKLAKFLDAMPEAAADMSDVRTLKTQIDAVFITAARLRRLANTPL